MVHVLDRSIRDVRLTSQQLNWIRNGLRKLQVQIQNAIVQDEKAGRLSFVKVMKTDCEKIDDLIGYLS